MRAPPRIALLVLAGVLQACLAAPAALAAPATVATPDGAPRPACVPSVDAKPPLRGRARKRRRKTLRTAFAAEPHADRSVAAPPASGSLAASIVPVERPVVSILGRKVEGPKGEDMGRVVDILADASGRVRVAIIDFGGFLGVGNRRIAVGWPLLQFHPDDDARPLVLGVSREQLLSAPEYRDSGHPRPLMVAPEGGTAP